MKLGNRWKFFLVGAIVLTATGCVRGPQVDGPEQLPVKRVVVYRNGVAYFERSGRVDEEEVRFRLRQENVGDFLATLAILEKGGSTVRAASFPVELEDEEESVDPTVEAALDAWEGKKPARRRGLREVKLELDGDEHELTVGYLAETPVWRPSYRLVVGGGGQAELQAWGIVQNQSGEDWKDVKISLVAGAPIAFESTLGDPVIPRRPIVTDSGEIVTAVPESNTSYHQGGAPPASPAESAEAEDDYYFLEEGGSRESVARKSSSKADASRGGVEKPASAPAPRPSPAGGAIGGVGAVQSGVSLAQVVAQSGSTRYDVPHTITVPDQSATMVLLVSKKIPGEAVYLYAPDGGVYDSERHPFRVVRFKNESGGLLEKGPIAVFEKGAFLGQGVMESLPLKASATVPFALARGLAIQKEYRSDRRDSRLYSIAQGNLVIEQDYASLTIYKVQNGEGDKVRLLVRHPRNPQAKLFQPPTGTEEDAGAGVALVPVQVPSFGKAELTVEERYPIQSSVSFHSLEGRAAIEDYLTRGKPTQAEQEALRKVLELSRALSSAADKEQKLRREQAELEKASRETRLSIEAIEKNTRAAQLRSELTERLRRTTARLDEITKELIELGLERSEQEVRLKEATQSLVVPPPDHRGGR